MTAIPSLPTTGGPVSPARRSTRWLLATVILGFCALPSSGSESGAGPSPGGTAAAKADWRRKCARRAEQTDMRDTLRRPFITQCVAGYRINATKDLQSKKEKF